MSAEKFRILITDGMAKEGLGILKGSSKVSVLRRDKTSKEEAHAMIGDFECVVVRSATTVTREMISLGKNLKLILRAGAGVDNIDVAAATERGIPVMNTASANSMAAAEQTIALIFSMLRSIPAAAQTLREGKWERSFKGYEVTGKTLGVLGLGHIGRIVAEKALGLGMNVVGYDPTLRSVSDLPKFFSGKEESFVLTGDPEQVVRQADILTVHVPKNKDTANFINASRISMMKDGAFVVNVARGGIVDEAAVLSALDSGKLRGAAFDVFEKEPPEFPNKLFTHAKVVCTPHLGASTAEAQERVALTAADQIISFVERGEKRGVVNPK